MTEVRRLREALSELVRAAADYANATGGISGDLGARLFDARALLADDPGCRNCGRPHAPHLNVSMTACAGYEART